MRPLQLPLTSVKESRGIHNPDVPACIETLLVVALLGDGAPADRGREVLGAEDLVAGVTLAAAGLADQHQPQLVRIGHVE